MTFPGNPTVAVFDSLTDLWLHYVPEYRSKTYKPFIASFLWDPRIAAGIRRLSDTRCDKRIAAYIIPGELERSSRKSRAIRFGHRKGGHNGIHSKERADFCLIGGVYEKEVLTVMYRSLELVGGLPFDTAIYRYVEKKLGRIKKVVIFSASAHVLALKRNNNDTYERVDAFFRGGHK